MRTSISRIRIVGLGFLTLIAPAMALPAMPLPREVYLPADHSIPAEVRFSNNRFLVIERYGGGFPRADQSAIAVLDRDGREIFCRPPGSDVPGAAFFSLLDAAVAPADTLVVAGATGPAANTDTAVSWVLLIYDISSRDVPPKIVRTNPVLCTRVAVGKDGSIWCLGPDLTRRPPDPGSAIVHRFDDTGRLVGSYVPLSSVDSAEPWARNDVSAPALEALDGEARVWLPRSSLILSVRDDGKVVERLDSREGPMPGSPTAASTIVGPVSGGVPACGSAGTDLIPVGWDGVERRPVWWSRQAGVLIWGERGVAASDEAGRALRQR